VASPSLGHVVGRTVRTQREIRGWSQEVTVRRLREVGLLWARSQLTDLETERRKDVTLGEAVLLAEAFGITLAELLPATGQVQVNATERPIRVLREMLAGERAPNSDLLGPTDMAGYEPERHGPGPYWTRSGARGSRTYSAAEVEAARKLGADVGRVHDAGMELNDGRVISEVTPELVEALRELLERERPDGS
jgi:transcriptional regulator with XRE-family HTH domain